MRVTAVRNGPATDTGDGTGPRTGPGHGRLVAVDAVRGLAVLGMFAVHVGPGPRPDGAGYLLVAADGRAPALFTPSPGSRSPSPSAAGPPRSSRTAGPCATARC